MAARLGPGINAADGWIVFLNSTVVVDTPRVVGHFVADIVDAQRGFLVHDVLLKRVLYSTKVCQLAVGLKIIQPEKKLIQSSPRHLIHTLTCSKQARNFSLLAFSRSTSVNKLFSTKSCTLSMPCRLSRWYKHSCATCNGGSKSSSALCAFRLESPSSANSANSFSSSVFSSFRQNAKSCKRSPMRRPASRWPWQVFSSVWRIRRTASLRSRSAWLRLISASA